MTRGREAVSVREGRGTCGQGKERGKEEGGRGREGEVSGGTNGPFNDLDVNHLELETLSSFIHVRSRRKHDLRN